MREPILDNIVILLPPRVASVPKAINVSFAFSVKKRSVAESAAANNSENDNNYTAVLPSTATKRHILSLSWRNGMTQHALLGTPNCARTFTKGKRGPILFPVTEELGRCNIAATATHTHTHEAERLMSKIYMSACMGPLPSQSPFCLFCLPNTYNRGCTGWKRPFFSPSS